MDDFIVIVSGLPRSGTSMIMRMLEAGGMPILTDNMRLPDEDNPRGYFEYAPVKRLHKDSSWIGEVRGKAIKIVSLLLMSLPEQFWYKVIFVERDLEEVLASQRAMLLRRINRGELPKERAVPEQLAEEDRQLRILYKKHLLQVAEWLRQSKSIEALFISHRDVLADPKKKSLEMKEFLGINLDEIAMAAAVERNLYRQRRT